jgi:dsDNA-binding SOS-regulon protein
MAVIVKYVVVRDGKQDMIFTTKKEADSYDKMLDIAERLYEYLQSAEMDIADHTLDALTFFMAEHRDQIGTLLKGGKLDARAASPKPAKPSPDKNDTAAASVTHNGEAVKSPRAAKAQAVA